MTRWLVVATAGVVACACACACDRDPPAAPSAPVAITAATGPVEMLADDGAVVAVGAPLPLGSAFAWTIENAGKDGYVLAYAVDGDLAHATRAPLVPVEGVTYELTTSIATVPVRFRVVAGEIHVQLGAVRRGTLALPGGAMAFALIGNGGRYDRDDEFVAFDLDRDGAIDLQHLDNPELFHVFERTVALDGVDYALEVAP